MHRNDADGFAPGGLYQEGAPGSGVLASKVGAKALNTFQNELAAIVEGAGLTLDDTDNGQLLEALGLLFSSGNAAAVLKNRLINGGFDLWQRGTSVPVASASKLTADRWVANADATGTGTATVSLQAFTLGQTAVPGNPRSFLRFEQTANATAGPILFQPIEDVARYSSGLVTVSFWAKASGNLNAASRVIQSFGTGGSSPVTVGVLALALTATWQRFSQTYTLPSVAGKTIGPRSFLRVGFSFPAGATFSVDLAEVQFETGQTATAFDRRPPQLEYLFAARYFEKSYASNIEPGTTTRSGALHQYSVTSLSGAVVGIQSLQEGFRVPKRTVPTVVWYAPNGNTAFPPGVGKITIGAAFSAPGEQFFAYPVVATVGTSPGHTGFPQNAPAQWTGPRVGVWAHWTADAELV